MSSTVPDRSLHRGSRRRGRGSPRGASPSARSTTLTCSTLEQERLFSRAWCFLAHESEIPAPGDYVTRHIGNNNIIVARAEDGVIHANLNMCRHRGNVMCKSRDRERITLPLLLPRVDLQELR